MRWWPVGAALALGGLAVAGGGRSASAEASAPSLSAAASAHEVALGGSVSLSGTVTDAGLPVSGAVVTLESDPYPYRGYVTVAGSRTAADGTYTLHTAPDRNTRLRVRLGASASASGVDTAPATITVDERVSLSSRRLGAGRVLLSARIVHTTKAGDSGGPVWWYVAPRGAGRVRLAAVTPAEEQRPGVSVLQATVDPPSARFQYRLCLNPSWEAAMGRPATHASCPRQDFTLAAHPAVATGGEARGAPRPEFPSAAAVASATAFLNTRAGHTALAVVTSAGRLLGVRTGERFETASVIKVMFLTAYLRMRAAQHRGLDAEDRALLYPMIHISDNDAASAVLARVGEPAIERLARESGMTAYVPGVGWWAFSQTDAADQARWFTQLSAFIPPQFYGYARWLLAGIEPSQSWGFPPVARPRWAIFYKTGALPSRGLFHEDALLEKDGVSFTVSVLTDGDPSMAYGEATIEGVAERLLGDSP